jgi:hypothetical protein
MRRNVETPQARGIGLERRTGMSARTCDEYCKQSEKLYHALSICRQRITSFQG